MPAIGALERIGFDTPVTFLMGENGCGKSTLIEALAVASGATAAGAHDVADDATLAGPRTLARAMTLVRRGRPVTRLFFRAEDAFGFTRRVERSMNELGDLARDLAADGRASEAARKRAAGFVAGQRKALASRYGEDPHAKSHGEAFLDILRQRIVPRGFYLLDEPETPLSPVRVLALLLLVRDAALEGSQFVIATHSPILAALPGATIYRFDGTAIVPTPYDELEHVRVTRDFLNAPERYLRRM